MNLILITHKVRRCHVLQCPLLASSRMTIPHIYLPHIAEQSRPARLQSQETLQVLHLQEIKSKSFSGAGERVVGVGCSKWPTKLHPH